MGRLLSISLLQLVVVVLYTFECTAQEEKPESKADVTVKVIWKPEECFRKVLKGDFVRYHYYGMLTNGLQFDSSYERGETYNTYTGTGWLIPGMDMGLIGMCLNEHRLITIPPELAYGIEGIDGIPPNATLIFNTVLLDIWNDNDTVQVTTTHTPPNCNRKLEASDYVRYHYNGTLLSGKPFHSSYDDGSTYDTYVGQGWVIKGMDEGLVGSCSGERRRILIPPFLAYGDKGDEKNIPRSATIVFDVEIVDFHNPKDTVEVTVTMEADDCQRKLIDSDFVRYHYNGSLVDGTVFDTSYQRNHTYDTYVGFKRVIPGMEIGLQGVCMGERRRIVIPPHLGYGERGVGEKIPPSAVLIFDIHVIDFHNPKDKAEVKVVFLPDECKDDQAPKAKNGDYVTFDYVMSLVNGEELDSNEGSTGDFGSYLGRGHLLPGVEAALFGMCVGEKRHVVVPPHIGYGEKGRDDMGVPGSALLVFDLELRKVEESLPKGMQFVWDKNAPESEELTFKEIDEDKDDRISLPELTSFIIAQVEHGNARLLPGHTREAVITDLFQYQDKDDDGSLTLKEFHVRFENDPLGSKAGDEL